MFMLWRLFNASQKQPQQQQCPQMTGLSEQVEEEWPGGGGGGGRNVTGPTSIAMNMIIFLTPVFIWANAEAVEAVPLSLCVCLCGWVFVCVCACVNVSFILAFYASI